MELVTGPVWSLLWKKLVLNFIIFLRKSSLYKNRYMAKHTL